MGRAKRRRKAEEGDSESEASDEDADGDEDAEDADEAEPSESLPQPSRAASRKPHVAAAPAAQQQAADRQKSEAAVEFPHNDKAPNQVGHWLGA